MRTADAREVRQVSCAGAFIVDHVRWRRFGRHWRNSHSSIARARRRSIAPLLGPRPFLVGTPLATIIIGPEFLKACDLPDVKQGTVARESNPSYTFRLHLHVLQVEADVMVDSTICPPWSFEPERPPDADEFGDLASASVQSTDPAPRVDVADTQLSSSSSLM